MGRCQIKWQTERKGGRLRADLRLSGSSLSSWDFCRNDSSRASGGLKRWPDVPAGSPGRLYQIRCTFISSLFFYFFSLPCFGVCQRCCDNLTLVIHFVSIAFFSWILSLPARSPHGSLALDEICLIWWIAYFAGTLSARNTRWWTFCLW